MQKINSSELSFVVQGPIYQDITDKVCKSIREYFPECEIVLSTWEGSSIEGLKYDKVVFSKDPGSIQRVENQKILMNANRQYISSKNGIAVGSRKFIIKTRSDIVFKNNNLLERLEKLTIYNQKDKEYSFLQNRIIVTNVTSVNPHKNLQMPFHLCDWFYAGLAEDIKNLFDIPLYPEEKYASWYATHPKPTNNTSDSLARYAAESYIISEFVRKYKNINFEHSFDISSDNIEISERVIANNFMIYSNRQLGFYSLKNFYIQWYYIYQMYTFYDWICIYKKYSLNKQNCINLFKMVDFYIYFFIKIQKFIIKILNILGIKETIKKFINREKSWKK